MADKDHTGEDHSEGNGPTDIPEETVSESELSLDKQAAKRDEQAK